MPRIYDDAAKPDRSPTTPPPRATIRSLRDIPSSARASRILEYVFMVLECSPSGKTTLQVWKPCSIREVVRTWEYRPFTLLSVTRQTLQGSIRSLIYLPEPFRISCPIRISYGRLVDTVNLFIPALLIDHSTLKIHLIVI